MRKQGIPSNQKKKLLVEPSHTNALKICMYLMMFSDIITAMIFYNIDTGAQNLPGL